MQHRKIKIWESIDWLIVGLYLALVLIGWISVYGASYEFDNTSILDYSGRAGKQLVWILSSLAIAFVILMLDKDTFSALSYVVYFIVILLLIATVLFAPDIKGSRSWLVIGPVRIQSAEFAKFAVALVLAKRISLYNFKLFEYKNFLSVAGLILLPMLLIFLQKETGSALVYLAFLIVLYREGMTGMVLVALFSAILFFILGFKYSEVLMGQTPLGAFLVCVLAFLFTVTIVYSYKNRDRQHRILLKAFGLTVLIAGLVHLFYPYNLLYAVGILLLGTLVYLLYLALKNWSKHYLLASTFLLGSVLFLFSVDYVFDEILEPHQQKRIKVALGMINEPQKGSYNVNQSKIAIGSGGLWGKGLLNGTQTKLKYVPEQDTDFIFCTVGEEQGFMGTTTVLTLFLVLLIRLISKAERQKQVFNRVYGYSVASILFFHFMINIGMVIGIVPVIGIPLPFFSYGGSSLWGFTILLFIFLKLDASKAERL